MLYKNSRLTVRPLEANDFEEIDIIDLQRNDLGNMRNIVLGDGVLPHQATGLNNNGDIVLMSGFVELWPKVFDVWTLFSNKWNPRLYKGATQWFDNYCNLLEFDRLQHILVSDRPWMKPVLQRFGFYEEGLMRKYANGQDCYSYARIKGEIKWVPQRRF